MEVYVRQATADPDSTADCSTGRLRLWDLFSGPTASASPRRSSSEGGLDCPVKTCDHTGCPFGVDASELLMFRE